MLPLSHGPKQDAEPCFRLSGIQEVPGVPQVDLAFQAQDAVKHNCFLYDRVQKNLFLCVCA